MYIRILERQIYNIMGTYTTYNIMGTPRPSNTLTLNHNRKKKESNVNNDARYDFVWLLTV